MERSTETGKTRCFTDHMMHALFFSGAVYGKSPDCVLRDLRLKFGNVIPLMHHGFDGEGEQAIFAARSVSGQVIVACRGTASLKDVLQDLKYFHSRLSYAQGAAHWGFAERAQSVPVELFCKLLEGGDQIIFTGHSLGGAVASLLSLRVLKMMKGSCQQQVQCITFGAPLFASRSLAEVINLQYKDVFIHVVGNKDFVPKILPVVSAIQSVLYGHEDYLEGLSVLSRGVSLLKWLPLAPMIQGLEKMIPLPFKFLIRCFLKLALPSTSWTYAFAGHVVVLDMDEKGPGDLLKPTCTDGLNLWYSQLNFAVAIGFDASKFMQHTTASYEHGVMRALARALSRHKVGSSEKRSLYVRPAAPVDCWRYSVTTKGGISPGMLTVSVVEDNCGSSREADGSAGVHDERSGCISSLQRAQTSVSRSPSGCCLCNDVRCSCSSPTRCDTAPCWRMCDSRPTKDSSSGKRIVMSCQKSSRSWPKKTTECLRLSCWEYPVVSRFLVEADGVSQSLVCSDLPKVLMRCTSADSSLCPRLQLRHCSIDGVHKVDGVGSSEEMQHVDTPSEGHWSGCRVCASMQVSKTYGQITKRAAVQKKGFDIGCWIRRIGQCSRHWRALNKLCFFTFFRIIMSHFIG